MTAVDEIDRVGGIIECTPRAVGELIAEIKRLRAKELLPIEMGECPLCRELRANNEQLRERVAELQASSGYEACIAQVEIERLRAALQRIADDGKNCQDYCRNQARRALESKP